MILTKLPDACISPVRGGECYRVITSLLDYRKDRRFVDDVFVVVY